MMTTVRKTIKYVLLFALAGVLVWLSLRKVEWTAFVSDLSRTRWGLVLLSLIPAVAALVFRVARWREMLKQLDPDQKFLKVWDSNSVGTFANTILPGSGEFVRCGGVSSPKAGFDKVLGTEVMERIWDIIAIIILVFLILVLRWDLFGPFFYNNVIEPASGRLSLLCSGLLFLALAVGFVWLCFAKASSNKFFMKMSSAFKGMWQGFVSFLKMERKWLFCIYTALIWFMYILMCWCCIKAVPALGNLNFLDAVVLSSIGNFASVIPVPGGIGAYHYLIATCITSLCGGTWEIGILFATISHESHALLVIILGVISYIHILISRRNKK